MIHDQLLEAFEAELNWFGTKRQAVIARFSFDPSALNSYIFWRFDGDDGAWALVGRHWFAPHLITIIPKAEVLDHAKICHRINSVTRSRKCCRMFFQEELKRYVTVKSSLGTIYRDIDMDEDLKIFIIELNGIRNWQCSETYKSFELALADKTSDAYFASRTINSGDSEAGLLVFGIDDPQVYAEQIKQFESLIIAILQCSESLWQNKNEYSIELPNYYTWGFKTSNSRLLGVPLDEKDEFWVNLVKRFGSLRITEKRLQKYSLKKDLMAFTVIAPTSHERIEAQIKLFEWAKAHLPSHKYAQVEAMESQL